MTVWDCMIALKAIGYSLVSRRLCVSSAETKIAVLDGYMYVVSDFSSVLTGPETTGTRSKQRGTIGEKVVSAAFQIFGDSSVPASDYCREHGSQIVEHSSDNETVLGSSQKPWEEPPNI